MAGFEEALKAIKDGYLVRNEPERWVGLQSPDENSKMTEPYLYRVDVIDDSMEPWMPSCYALLCNHWEVVMPASEYFKAKEEQLKVFATECQKMLPKSPD